VAYVVLCAVALLASALTLVSGFGLGTLLLPAFALFVPIELAVSATAAVHLANNLFKLALVGRHASRRVVLAFGLPAVPAALGGAWVLIRLARLPDLGRWSAGGREFAVGGVDLAVAALIVGFALLELSPAAERLAFAPRWLPLGGLLSGFCGGLSGHQGALRSAFLLRSGLSKETFVASGVACAVLVDLARIAVYGVATRGGMPDPSLDPGWGPLLAAAAAALAGSIVGVRWLGTLTLGGVRRIVGGLLLALGLAIGCGIV